MNRWKSSSNGVKRFIGNRSRRETRQTLQFERCEPRLALAAPEFDDGEVTGNVETSQLVEASGLVASRQHADVLWTHNDNGDSRLFAMDAEGEHLGTYDTGVDARDWEDLAIGPGPAAGVDYIYIADTGDNAEARDEIAIYRVAEPDVDVDQSPVTTDLDGVATLRFVYPDGAHDAETLLVDPLSGDIFIITKRDARSRVYHADFPHATAGVTTLAFVGELSWTAAASGDISPDGDEIILKNLSHVYYYPRSAGMTIADALAGTAEELPYTPQTLGEGLTFDARGEGYFTNSEGVHEPLYYYERMSSETQYDLDGDGRVDRRDAAVLARNFGRKQGATWRQGDVDGDGSVTLADVAMVQRQLVGSGGSPGSLVGGVVASSAGEAKSETATTRLTALRRTAVRREVVLDAFGGDLPGGSELRVEAAARRAERVLRVR